jgi:hypothetical protein
MRQPGETVYHGYGFYNGQTYAGVGRYTVVAEVEGVVVVRDQMGVVRDGFQADAIQDTEAEAWERAAAKLAAIRDAVQAELDKATAAAAAARVGEAVPA